jgi:hypothetical protein
MMPPTPQPPHSAPPARPTGPPPDLHGLVWERYVRTLDIKRRLHVLRPFADELDRATRGKPFRFRNDIVWSQMLDLRDKLVIDLCSLTVEMRHGMKPLDPKAQQEYRGGFKRKRGMFIELREHHLASLTRTYVPHEDDDEDEVARCTQGKAKIFARLFPTCATESPSAADVEDLCERFRIRMIPLRDDRNKNRAHALEGDAGTAKMLWVPELEDLFTYQEGLLEDLSLVSAGSAFSGDNMNHADCRETAADMVDLILFGNIADVKSLTATRTREKLYARLHEIDDAVQEPKREKLHFNDRQFTEPFEDFVANLNAGVRAVHPQ